MITKTKERRIQEIVNSVFKNVEMCESGLFFQKRFMRWYFLCGIDKISPFDIWTSSEEVANILNKADPSLQIQLYPVISK